MAVRGGGRPPLPLPTPLTIIRVYTTSFHFFDEGYPHPFAPPITAGLRVESLTSMYINCIFYTECSLFHLAGERAEPTAPNPCSLKSAAIRGNAADGSAHGETTMFLFPSLFATAKKPVTKQKSAVNEAPFEPQFVFPETHQEYERRVANRVTDFELEKLALREKAAGLRRLADEFLAKGGNPAQVELNRRTAERLRNDAKYLSCARLREPEELAAECRSKEAKGIIEAGNTLMKNSCKTARRNGGPHDTEEAARHIVKFRGRIFLVVMYTYDGELKLITDSVQQMNYDELKCAAKFM